MHTHRLPDPRWSRNQRSCGRSAASEPHKQHELNHSSCFTVHCKEWNPVIQLARAPVGTRTSLPSPESVAGVQS